MMRKRELARRRWRGKIGAHLLSADHHTSQARQDPGQEGRLGDPEVLVEGTDRHQALQPNRGVIRVHGLLRRELPVDHLPHVADHLEGRLRELDLAAEEGHPGAVPLGVGEELERVPVGPRRPAEDSHDQLGVVGAELAHGARAVVGDLEEAGPLRPRQPREAADDAVCDVGAGLLQRGEARVDVGVEHLQEVAHAAALRVLAEVRERLETPQVVVHTVVEGDRVEAEVAPERARPGERGGAVRPRRLGRVAVAPHAPDVRRVVGANSGGHGRALEDVRPEPLQGRRRDQHHVDDSLTGDRSNLVEVACERPERVERPPVRAALGARGGPPAAHVGILGVRDNEVGPRAASLQDRAELTIECLHAASSQGRVARPRPTPPD